MKKIFVFMFFIVFVFSFSLVALSGELLTFSKDALLIEDPEGIMYISVVNQSEKETVLYEIDEFPDFVVVSPLEGKIFPLGEERIKVRLKRGIEPEYKEGDIVFIYAKKSNPRNLIYKRIKVKFSPSYTPVPSTPSPSPSPTPTPTPLPILSPTPSPSPTATPTPYPSPTPTYTPIPLPISTPEVIKIEKVGVVGERPLVYKEGMGFVPLDDEIAIGEEIKFYAVLDQELLSSFDSLSWESDPDTEIVKVEGERGEIITVKRGKKGTGSLLCKVFGKNGKVLAQGSLDFQVDIGEGVLENTKKVKEEISRKLKDAKSLYNMKDLDGAKAIYQEVLKIDPNNKDAKYGIARVEKAERTRKKVVSIYEKAKYYLKKGDIKGAYRQIMAIGNYMWAFPKQDPLRKEISSLKAKILALYTPTSGKIRKYKAPGTNIYIYTGTRANLSLFSKKLGTLLYKELEIPGFNARYKFYGFSKGLIVQELKTGRWEGIFKDFSKTYTLDLAFLKILTVNKKLISQLGKGRTPGIFLFKGRIKVQIFDSGVIVEEEESKTVWYKVY